MVASVLKWLHFLPVCLVPYLESCSTICLIEIHRLIKGFDPLFPLFVFLFRFSALPSSLLILWVIMVVVISMRRERRKKLGLLSAELARVSSYSTKQPQFYFLGVTLVMSKSGFCFRLCC